MSRLTVLFDGSCTLCCASVARARRFDRHQQVEFLDLHDPQAAARFPQVNREDAMRLMQAVDSNGHVFAGVDAWARIGRLLPGWNLVAWILLVPGIHWLAARIYAWIARNRYRWNSAICADDTCNIHRPKPQTKWCHPEQSERRTLTARETIRGDPCGSVIIPAMTWFSALLQWFVAPAPPGPPGRLVPRWIFLRALGLFYFSAFYSLVFQIRGLLGPDGLLPLGSYFQEVAKAFGSARFWYAPTLLWFDGSSHALIVLCWVGMGAAVLLTLNFWPRAMLSVCFAAFLSFVSAAQDFSSYQSDGMLLSAGFISLFFAPPNLRPRWGESSPPSRASLLLLQLVWFTIYFESGFAKYFGGDPSWRTLIAMDQYYQNGPLPTWIGWYIQQLPHWFHASAAFFTLFSELLVVWMLFLPRRFRIVCVFIVTPLQISIILTANYTFLNYLVLSLGVLLLDDRFLLKFLPPRWAAPVRKNLERPSSATFTASALDPHETASLRSRLLQFASASHLWLVAFLLFWIFYAMAFPLASEVFQGVHLPTTPVMALEPFRIANRYGLFGRMTWARYEIEFQGSDDGVNWIAYPFRYKPQDLREPPRIYAPYQPRFDWNLWFASLGYWPENPFVIHTEQLLLQNDSDVLSLFAANPFPKSPPHKIRAVLWQYWFTDLTTKRATGCWWRRDWRGLYAPALERAPDGKIFVTDWPQALPPPP